MNSGREREGEGAGEGGKKEDKVQHASPNYPTNEWERGYKVNQHLQGAGCGSVLQWLVCAGVQGTGCGSVLQWLACAGYGVRECASVVSMCGSAGCGSVLQWLACAGVQGAGVCFSG